MSLKRQGFAVRIVLCALLVYALGASLYRSSRRLLWFDELFTKALAERPTYAELWSALEISVDGQPPAFYEVERAASHVVGDVHIAYRLPSVLAFIGIPVSLFIFVRRRRGDEAALVAAMVPFVTPLFRYYAIEARPYALTTCAIAMAMPLWQDLNGSWLRRVLFGVTLVCATSLHYFAVLALGPFIAAETWGVIRTRKVRISAWMSFAVALIPFAICWPLLRSFKQANGAHFWAQPSLFLVFGDAFGVPGFLIAAMSLTLGVILGIGILQSFGFETRFGMTDVPSEELILVGAFIALPAIAFVALRMLQGPLIGRYILSTVLGVAAALAFAVSSSANRNAMRATLVFLVSVFLLFQVDAWRDEPTRPARARQLPAITSLEALLTREPMRGRPLVIANSQSFLPISYYAGASEEMSAAVYLADEEAAVRFVNTDTGDRSLVALQPYMHLNVVRAADFFAAHKKFLVFSDDQRWEWIIRKSVFDGASVRLVANKDSAALYAIDCGVGRRASDAPVEPAQRR